MSRRSQGAPAEATLGGRRVALRWRRVRSVVEQELRAAEPPLDLGPGFARPPDLGSGRERGGDPPRRSDSAQTLEFPRGTAA